MSFEAIRLVATAYARNLPNHAAAVLAIRASTAVDRRAVEISVCVEDHCASRIGAIAVIKIVEVIGRAGSVAVRRHLEYPTVIMGASCGADAI